MKKLFLSLIFILSAAVCFSQFPITQNIGAPNTQVVARGGMGSDSGFVYRKNFTDTTTANLGYLDNIAGITIRTGNTLWIRSNDATKWIEFGAGALNVDTTQSVILSGDGSLDDPLTANVQLSEQQGNLLQLYPDGIFATTPIQNGRISGGAVIWESGLTYTVTPATYSINGIVYTSPETEITLDNADPSDDRIDGFVVNTSETADKLTGTPATDPQNPSYDPTTELPLTFVLVSAASTEPAFCRDSIYFPNNGQTWTASVSNATRINVTSTNNPYSPTQDIELTLAQNNDQLRLTKSSAVTLTTYSYLVFKILSKAAWATNSRINIRWYNGLTPLGVNVALGNGIFGFVSSNTATYQTIAIPVTAFGAVVNSDNILFSIFTTGSNRIGAYIDNIELIGCGGTPTPVNNSFWQVGGNMLGTTLVGGTLDNNPVAFVVNNTERMRVATNGKLIVGSQVDNGVTASIQTGSVIPHNDNASNIGASTRRWNTVFSDNLAGATMLTLTVNSTTRMRINNAGEVFIGSSPVADVSSTFTIGGTSLGSRPMPSLTTTQRDNIATPSTSLMVYNTTTNRPEYYNGSSWTPFGQTYTASNGLTMSSNNVVLGGTALSGNTTIPTSAFSLTINSSNTTNTLSVTNSGSNGVALRATGSGNSVGVYATSVDVGAIFGQTSSTLAHPAFAAIYGLATGNTPGLYGESTSGEGIYALSHGGLGARINRLSSANNTVLNILNVSRSVISGGGADGIGAAIEFSNETSASNISRSNRLISIWENATDRKSLFQIWGDQGGGIENPLIGLKYTGQAQAYFYGSGTFTGTPTFALAVDADGDIIEIATGSGMTNPMTTTGDIIYSSDNSGTPARLGIGTSGQVLTVSGGGIPSWTTVSGTGSVTNVSFTGGLISVADPTTTPALTVAGTSGGVPYFSSTSTWASSAALAANAIVIGGGAGAAPATTTTAAGIVTFIGTPSSANLASAVTDETGSGLLVFATSPTLTTPNLGTPSAVTLTNATGLPLSTGVTGTLADDNGGTGQSTYTTGDILYASGSNTLSKLAVGTANQVLTVSGGIPQWITPGTGGTVTSVTLVQPSAGIVITNSGVAITTSGTRTFSLSNDLAAVEGLATTGIVRRTATDTWTAGTAVSLTSEVTGTLPVSNGGTGQSTYSNGELLIGNGSGLTKSTLTGTSNQISISNGSGSITISHAFNPTVQTLTSGASISWNITNGANSQLTLNATGATLSISNAIAGYTYTIRIIQGSGGSKTITTWPTGTRWSGGTSPTLSTTAGQMDIISFFYDGSNYYGTFNSNMQ